MIVGTWENCILAQNFNIKSIVGYIFKVKGLYSGMCAMGCHVGVDITDVQGIIYKLYSVWLGMTNGEKNINSIIKVTLPLT